MEKGCSVEQPPQCEMEMKQAGGVDGDEEVLCPVEVLLVKRGR